MAGPLSGYRVMDVTIAGVGPWGTSLLAQMGADVIKIESPEGDGIRRVRPTLGGMGTTYIACNMSKRGITLNLKDPSDYRIALKLASGCDVFVENFKRGVIQRLKLGYEQVAEVNPRIVYVSSSGVGEKGPLSNLGWADGYVQAFSGFGSVNGQPGGRWESLRYYGSIDMTSAMHITQAVLLGLYHRELTGVGQKIEVSMLGSAINMQASRIAEYLASGKNPGPMGSAVSNCVPNQAFKARDRYFTLAVTDQPTWERFCRAIKREELMQDGRFVTNADRVAHREELVEKLQSVFSAYPADWWLILFDRHNIPAGPIMRFRDWVHHPQVVENQMVADYSKAIWGKTKVVGLPWKFDRTPGDLHPGPAPGEHTKEVLSELGS